MFGVSGIADGLLIFLMLAALGSVLLIALPMTFILKFAGMPFGRAFAWGFGIPFALLLVGAAYSYAMWSTAPEPEAVTITIPRPTDVQEP